MKDFPWKILTTECILISILLVFCATQKKETFDQVIMQSQQQMVGGHYQKALDHYIVACEKNPEDKLLLENYLMTVKRIKQTGDMALEAENFALAEKIYSVLLKNYSHFKKFDPSLSFTKNSLSITLRNCRISLSERQSRQYLDADEFEKAINSYRVRYLEYPNDPVLLTNLINIILDLKFLAEIAITKEDFLSTGRIYCALLKNYKYFNKFYKSLSLPKKFLDEGLNNCRLQLTKKGLEHYRKGNLADAIIVWKGILKFDPDNQQIKKAIETATTQLKNLRKKEIQ
jgi:tetratricopeptide (TPR) repeat protein